ncbi:MAG: nucleotide exchange factor GrpE, partial [Candidatus Phytoplasma australasiaticum]|nr:nucleotide exchange factor GrpE [Candidatus Phytoplasma australasiaticum]
RRWAITAIPNICHQGSLRLRDKFDPNFHYALEKISDLKQPNGINVLVLQKGFLYKDLVIKPAMVKVNEWSDKNND